jgi:rubrerythrin
MTIEKALLEALRYETRIRDLYLSAARDAAEPGAAEFYRRLGEDERRHADYLEAKIAELRKMGTIVFEDLVSSLPDPGTIETALRKSGASLAGPRPSDRPRGGTPEALQRALSAEEGTSALYRELAGTLTGPAGEIFARFLEIEEGHLRIVRAELDLSSSTGFWFDFKEFDQEE